MVPLLNMLDRFLHVAALVLQVLLAAAFLLALALGAEAIHLWHHKPKSFTVHHGPPPPGAVTHDKAA